MGRVVPRSTVYVDGRICYGDSMSLPAASIQIIFHADHAVVTLVERDWQGRRHWDREKGRWDVPISLKELHALPFLSAVNLVLRELDDQR